MLLYLDYLSGINKREFLPAKLFFSIYLFIHRTICTHVELFTVTAKNHSCLMHMSVL